MTFRTFTLDLTDRVEEIENRLDEIDERLEEVEAELNQAMAEDGVDDPTELDDWNEYDDEYSDLEAEKGELKGTRGKFMDAVVHWMTDLDVTENPSQEEVAEKYAEVDHCIFKAEELSFGQVQSVSDDMVEKSFDMDMERQDIEGTPKQGYMQIELLREAIVDWPGDAPTRTVRRGREEPEPGDYPEPVAKWLFDKVDAFNTTQEKSLGNSSLEEKMKSER